MKKTLLTITLCFTYLIVFSQSTINISFNCNSYLIKKLTDEGYKDVGTSKNTHIWLLKGTQEEAFFTWSCKDKSGKLKVDKYRVLSNETMNDNSIQYEIQDSRGLKSLFCVDLNKNIITWFLQDYENGKLCNYFCQFNIVNLVDN